MLGMGVDVSVSELAVLLFVYFVLAGRAIQRFVIPSQTAASSRTAFFKTALVEK